jgi:hypothetical protein
MNITSPLIDISSINSSGEVVINQNGVYVITYSATGHLETFAPFTPWSFGLFLDGTLVSGSVACSVTTSGDDFRTVTKTVIMTVLGGQTLTLQNVSLSNVTLLSNVSGGAFPDVSASIEIFQLKKL